MRPSVSIIVPNYNHEAYLQERLDSIFNQSFQDIEVILLDDASRDGSVTLLQQYKNHPKVSHVLCNQKNTGSPFLQWQKGLELAVGDYIWIAESDDSCERNFLETQLQILQAADVAVARTKTFSSVGVHHEIAHPVFGQDTETRLTTDSLLYCPILNVSAVVFKRSLLQHLEQFQFTAYSIIGDRVFYYEAFQGKYIHKNEATTSYFRQEGTGVSNLDHKDISYLAQYFEQHLRFLAYVASREILSKEEKQVYVDRFFARVRDRLTRREKLSFTYLKILWRYMKHSSQ
ncbi:MAG: glycosyltransferase family 2 protein [Marinirhabdus sp.]|nr:glycosyltransferase family 2 protein [Marinirhabdus sp.]